VLSIYQTVSEEEFSEVYPSLAIEVPEIRKLGDTPRRLLCLSLHLGLSTRTRERSDGCTTQTAAAGRPVAGRPRAPPVGLPQGETIVVPAPSNRSMGTVLAAWAVVVLDAAVPRYACCGWGGPSSSDGRGGIEGRERSREDLILEVPRRGPLVRRGRDVRAAYGTVVRERAEDG
jgi:hypothetical protein